MYGLATFLRMMDKTKSKGQSGKNIFVCPECKSEYPQAFKEKCKKCSQCCLCNPADKIVAEKKQMLLDIKKEQNKLKSKKEKRLNLLLGIIALAGIIIIVTVFAIVLN